MEDDLVDALDRILTLSGGDPNRGEIPTPDLSTDAEAVSALEALNAR